MARYAQLTLLGFAVLMLAGLGHVLLDLQGKQLAQRNNQRAKDVIYFLDRLEAYAQENNAVPSFPSSLQHIGSAEHGCALSTRSCQISNGTCLNLNNLMNNRDLSVPSDLKIGSYYKTGYAAKIDPQSQTITIVACGAEQGASIQASRGFHELLVPRPLKNAKK